VNRRLAALIAAIALAVVGTVAIVAWVNGAEDRALEGETVVNVLVVKEEVPAGTPAEDLGDRVKLERVTEKVKAEGAVTTVTALRGKVASATLVPGEQVVEQRFVEASAFQARGTQTVAVPEGLLQTTISVDPERAIGGLLTPGAKVALSLSFDQGVPTSDATGTTIDPAAGGGVKTTHVTLRNVLVTNVQSNAEFETTSEDDEEDQVFGEAPEQGFLVTVALSDVDTERLVFAAEWGKVWISIEPVDGTVGPTKVVTHGNVYTD